MHEMIKDFFEDALIVALSIFVVMLACTFVVALAMLGFKGCELLFNLLW
jgi:hypothetical protein